LTEETHNLLLADLKRDEGRKDLPYRDSRGILTIGYGHNLEAAPLCEAALQAQLACDLTTHLAALDAALPWWRQQPEPVQRVLGNMGFNLGAGRLVMFKQTLAAIQAGNYREAAAALRSSLYAKQVGERAERLAKLLETCYNATS
jgi:lysozyme